MLTVAKLGIYKKFDGDIDGWARSSTGDDKSNITDNDWYLIDTLVMDLALIKGGVASPHFSQEVESKLLASTVDEATRELLHALADRQALNNAA